MSSLAVSLAFPSTVQWLVMMEVLIVTVTAGVCSGRSILSLTNQSMTCDNGSLNVTAASELTPIVPATESAFHLCIDIYVLDIYSKCSHILIK
jgi:hypothetical protein